MMTSPYADARPLLKTGDVLLAVGKDNDLMAVGVPDWVRIGDPFNYYPLIYPIEVTL